MSDPGREPVQLSPDPGKWLEDHGDYLFRYAAFRLRDDAAAEDAVQETFLAALKAYDKFEGRGSERTWLVGILKHKIIDHFRRLKREDAVDEGPEHLEFSKAPVSGLDIGMPITHRAIGPRYRMNSLSVAISGVFSTTVYRDSLTASPAHSPYVKWMDSKAKRSAAS